MKLQFLGATGTVTGSKFLLTTSRQKVLIDCGLFQGLKQLRLKNWRPFPVDPKEIDAVIFTHAHIDHTGYFPLLVKKGFNKKAYSTFGTRALCNILLPDAAYLQEEEARYLNKHKLTKHDPALPLYTMEEAQTALSKIHPVDYNKELSIGDIRIRFVPVSHLLGASFVEIEADGETVVFSGDVGRDGDPLLNDKQKIKNADYLIVESTYGDRVHGNEDVLATLEKIIVATEARGGITLIPSFAVGRAQAILFYLNKLKKANRIPDVPVFLNSPMAIQATHIYKQFANDLRVSSEEVNQIFSGVQFVRDAQESMRLNESRKPSIILSASGMITGGRILHHLKSLGPDEKNSLVIVGFQSAGTRGEALLRGKRELRIHGQTVPIRAAIHNLENISAHADSSEMISWLSEMKKTPKKTFVVHGEPVAADEMRKLITQKFDWNCYVPEYGEEVTL